MRADNHVSAQHICLTKGANASTCISIGFLYCPAATAGARARASYGICWALLAEIKKSCLVERGLSSSKQHLQAAAPSVALASWGPGQARWRWPGPRWRHLVGETSFLSSCGAKPACLFTCLTALSARRKKRVLCWSSGKGTWLYIKMNKNLLVLYKILYKTCVKAWIVPRFPKALFSPAEIRPALSDLH